MKFFLFENQFFAQKYKIFIIICSDDVFSIIVWDFIKIDSKLQKLQPFSSIYPNEKLGKFQKLWLLKNVFSYPIRLNPSIVVTAGIKSIINKLLVILLEVCKIFEKSEYSIGGAKLFLRSIFHFTVGPMRRLDDNLWLKSYRIVG